MVAVTGLLPNPASHAAAHLSPERGRTHPGGSTSMMRMRAALLACVVGVGFANAAQAQIMGRAFELSGQAGAMFFDPRSNFDTGPLVAGSLGWRYAPRVSFELSGMVTKTKHPPGDGDAWFSTLGGDLRLALRDPGSRIVPFMMGGL